MAKQVVYALSDTGVVLPSGVYVKIHPGEHWPASDPVVRAHPHLFTTDPYRVGLRISAPLEDAPVHPPADQLLGNLGGLHRAILPPESDKVLPCPAGVQGVGGKEADTSCPSRWIVWPVELFMQDHYVYYENDSLVA